MRGGGEHAGVGRLERDARREKVARCASAGWMREKTTRFALFSEDHVLRHSARVSRPVAALRVPSRRRLPNGQVSITRSRMPGQMDKVNTNLPQFSRN